VLQAVDIVTSAVGHGEAQHDHVYLDTKDGTLLFLGKYRNGDSAQADGESDYPQLRYIAHGDSPLTGPTDGQL
jgi:hypothetical protein